jgi:hypothetical protein
VHTHFHRLWTCRFRSLAFLCSLRYSKPFEVTRYNCFNRACHKMTSVSSCQIFLGNYSSFVPSSNGCLGQVLRHDIGEKKQVGTISEAYPHLILENFSSALGERVGNILKFLFPAPTVTPPPPPPFLPPHRSDRSAISYLFASSSRNI